MAKNETKVDITGDASGLDKEAKRGADSLHHMGDEGERAADKASAGARKTTTRMEKLRGKIGEVGKRFGPMGQAAVTEEVMATAAMRGQDFQQVAAIKNMVARLTTAGAISEGDAGKIESESLRFAALHGGTQGTESPNQRSRNQTGAVSSCCHCIRELS